MYNLDILFIILFTYIYLAIHFLFYLLIFYLHLNT